ncbi:ATP-binding cassette domain-containing protein [Staphylococcus devriesei]|uniref:Methionine ABC transporter ATP-binding protein n=1 Tax=Staphylococcus devriesei TaxID=586733 RepID=A0A2K4DSS8_9STAP|nr:ATP-binding cassette domain-containing protein [Staphylococcus devriesei]MCE5096943.1 ATP-binding cassette domain-containing protein [Staphylococcus devriesei]PNZ89868.1 methionine ABC transporter ATP-binding protein [Staphylococcus devriesei]PTE73476.1 methionine ABC transporter ATP-binding protein [Staphylococcus devriesei]PTF04803.1 methionine ABC transporter ATP-binding protein [Staphylococcus devriesei]PTF15002.1 methionine ABC transporter ATP-binding protein [Staphylococcus devriesei]
MLLEVKHLTYKADRRIILDDVNFQLEAGETVAIIGPSGSGKSTFLKQINNLISPTKGDLLFKGKPYNDYPPEELRSKISYLMQQSQLFGETIRDNMAFPSLAHGDDFDEEKAQQLLEKVSLGHYKLNDRIEHLSGGERQRITIARQLMYRPEILLLDESTSALDTHNKEKIEDIIFELAREGVAILWITHSDDESMRYFQRRITIADGQITKEEDLNQDE